MRNNLPPESQPWGRDIEKRLSDLEFGNQVALNRGTNTNDGVLATLRQLSTQIATLVEQQATLSTQQTNITTLLSSQIFPVVAPTVTTSPADLTTTYAIVASTSIPVPSGYTRALVFGIGSMHLTNNGTGGTQLYSYVALNGNNGNANIALISPNTQRSPSLTVPEHSVSLTGLSGGNISLTLLSGLGSASGISQDLKHAQIGGFALFLK